MASSLMRYRRPMVVLAAVVLLGLAGAGYVRHVNWRSTLAAMRHASLLILGLATACHLVSLLSKAGAWFVWLRALGTTSYRIVVRATFVGATLNGLFIGSVGEAGRVVIMTRATGLRAYAVLTTVALERLLNTAGFVAVLCAALVITPLRVAAAPAALAAAVLLVAALWMARRFGGQRHPAFPGRAASGARRFQRVWRVHARRIAKTARHVVTPRRLGVAVPLTLLDWTCQLASYHLVARAAHLPLGISGSLVALLVVNVGLVARVTPGNLGVFEIAYATAAHSLGAPMDAALGVGLLIHLAQDLPTIVLGVVLGRQVVFGRDRASASTPGRTSVVRSAIRSPSPGGTTP
ncbi:MAG TPA: lysylphosphatidylglycerol synthase transmembrane domain-containing protein [Gemmatimonadaceae bacterium]|nr:lysylphosphatidylglycerol synthase transmembrane domain-containing protein [Gemmatimonadaceae bacterium]